MRLLAAAALCTACSIPGKHFEAIDAPGGTADTPVADAPVGGPDAHVDAHVDGMIDAGAAAMRGALLAIQEVTVIDADAKTLGLRGGAITIQFADLTQGGGTVLSGTTPINGCVVTQYSLPNKLPNPEVDAGTVTISGNGLLRPVGPCNFTSASTPYDCVSMQATASIQAISSGGVCHYIVAGGNFANDSTAAYLDVHGFQNNAFNGRNPIGGAVDSDSNGTLDELEVAIPNPPTVGTSETKTMTYKIVDGAGPIPAAVFGVSGDYLASTVNGTQGVVRVVKGPDPDWPALDVTIPVRGEGYALATSGDLPTAFPTTARNVQYTCVGTGGNCGAEVTPPTGEFNGTLIFGSTTDANVNGLPDFAMPPPVSSFTTFQCAYLLSDSATIPQAAVQAILSTNPRRIEINVGRVTAAIVNGNIAQEQGNIVVGHAIVGHTTL